MDNASQNCSNTGLGTLAAPGIRSSRPISSDLNCSYDQAVPHLVIVGDLFGYFALIPDGGTAEQATGLVRRLPTSPRPTDEAVGRDLEWHGRERGREHFLDDARQPSHALQSGLFFPINGEAKAAVELMKDFVDLVPEFPDSADGARFGSALRRADPGDDAGPTDGLRVQEHLADLRHPAH